MIAQMSKVDLRPNLRELVLTNVDQVVRKARVMSCKLERDRVSILSPLHLHSSLTSLTRSHQARPFLSTRASWSCFSKLPRHRISHEWSPS